MRAIHRRLHRLEDQLAVAHGKPPETDSSGHQPARLHIEPGEYHLQTDAAAD